MKLEFALPRAIRSGVWMLLLWLCGVAVAQGGPLDSLDLLSPSLTVDQTAPEIKEAIGKYEKSDFDGAYEALKKASEKNPAYAPPRTLMALLHMRFGQTAAGVATLEQAAVDAPQDAEAFLLLGDVAAGSGRLVEAELLFAKAMQLAESYSGDATRKKLFTWRAHAGLALVAEQRTDWQLARQHLEAWLGIEPDSYVALYRLGRAKFLQNPEEPAPAVADLEKAYEKAKDKVPPAGVTMMQLCQQIGDEAKARQWAKSTINSLPDNLNAQLAVASFYLQTAQPEQAKQHVEQAIKIDPNSLEAKVLRGVVARFLHDYDQAEEFLEAAKMQAPSNFVANNQLALVLIESRDEGKRRRALELAELNLKTNSSNPEAAWTFGWILLRSGRLADARQVLQSAMAQRRQLSPDAAYFMARLSNDLGRADSVREFLDLALKSKAAFAYRQQAQEWRQQLPEEEKP